MKFLLSYLLACCYSFANRWVNPKYGGDVMWTTQHGFLTPISFILASLYSASVYYLNGGHRHQDFYVYLIPLVLIVLVVGYGLKKPTIRALKDFDIIKEHKRLSKRQKKLRNTVAFLFFFFSFFQFIYFGVKFIAP